MKKHDLTANEQKSLETFQHFKITYPNFYRWIKICAVFIGVVVPIIIWLVYFIGEKVKGIPTDIQAGDALGFYGSFLAFVGTVALGSISVYQTHKAHKLNEILINSKSIPSISIDGCSNRDGAGDIEFSTGASNSGCFLKSNFINISETAIINFSISFINGNRIDKVMNNTALGVNKSKKVFLWSKYLNENNINIIQISLTNAIGYEYTQQITFTLKAGLPYDVKISKPQKENEQ